MRPVASRVAALAVLAAALGLAALGLPALAAEPVEVIDVDAAARAVAPGGNATFEWTVRNLDTIPYNVSIAVDPAAGWTTVVDPPQVAGLAPNRAATVRVHVVAPPRVHEETTVSLLVRFAVNDDGAVVALYSRNATLTIPSALADKLVLNAFENPLPAPLDNEWGVFLLDVVVWLAIAGAVRFLLDPIAKAFTKRTKTEVDDIIMRIVRTPLSVLLFLYGALNSLTALDAHLPSWLIGAVLIAYGVGSSLIFFYLGYRIFRDVFLHIMRGVAKRTASNLDDVFIPLVEKIGLVALAIAALGLLLGLLNVDLTLFVAGGVVTSMVIAFAAQDTLSNFFSGMFLLTDRPFKEGDTVILSDGDWVEVRRIGMRTTRLLRFSDGAMVTIPNNRLVNEKIANFTNPRDQGRMEMSFEVALGSDPAKVKGVLSDVIGRCPHLVKQAPFTPVVRFDALKDAGLRFFVLVFIDHRDSRFEVRDFLNTETYKGFEAAGIDVAVPQRAVQLRLGGGEAALARPVRAPVWGAPTKAQEAAAAPTRVGEAPKPEPGATVGPAERVGDLFDDIVGPATTVKAGSPLLEAVKALLTVPVTRKVYVVDAAGVLAGTLTMEDLMRAVTGRLGAGESATGAVTRHLRELGSQPVEGFARPPSPVTRDTRLADIARRIVEQKLNDLPVVDGQGKLLGELNSQKLLEAVLPLIEPGKAEGAQSK